MDFIRKFGLTVMLSFLAIVLVHTVIDKVISSSKVTGSIVHVDGELKDITNILCFNLDDYRVERYSSDYKLNYARAYNPDNIISVTTRPLAGAITQETINKFGTEVKRSLVSIEVVGGQTFQWSGYIIGEGINKDGIIYKNPMYDNE